MKVTKEVLGKSQVKLIIELDEQEVQQYKQQAAKRLSEQVKIPGFRPGTAGYDVVKLHVGDAAITKQMIDLALPVTYSKAVTDEKLPVVSRPQVNILTEEPFKYEAIVALLPDVKVTNYKNVKIDVDTAKVEDKDVDNVFDNLRKHYATYTPVTDRPVKKGDRVEIDFNGTDTEGVAIEGTASKNHPLVVGENTLIPGFEENLEGMKIGETKTFQVTFPKDYHAAHFQGKVVNFETTMQKADEPKLPELNDEFVEQVVGEKKTLAELTKEIRGNLEGQRKNEVRMKQEDKLLEALLERTEAEIPEQLIDEEVEYIIEDLKADLTEKGIAFDMYLKTTKKTMEDLMKDNRKEAEKRIKIRLALQFLFTEEKIEADDKDIDMELEEITGSYPEAEREKAKKEFKGNQQMLLRIKNRAMLRKLFDKLLDTTPDAK
ncbi:trigger factor [Candidatus Gracilibacteria bacterium]|nr:trigger factor [Candidatus Gracilibacteria bacterium]